MVELCPAHGEHKNLETMIQLETNHQKVSWTFQNITEPTMADIEEDKLFQDRKTWRCFLVDKSQFGVGWEEVRKLKN